jgi:hypothetical protein
MPTPQRSDEDAAALITTALAAADDNFSHWPQPLVKRARDLWMRTQGLVPTIQDVANEVGPHRADRLISDALERRRLVNDLLGYQSPCHYCGSLEDLCHLNFALLRVEASRRNWAATATTAFAGAISLATLGAAAIALPTKSHSGAGLAMRLVVCKSCRKKNANIFGLFMMNEGRASNHPLWNALQEAGFTKFLTEENMPWELKISPETSL